MTDNVTANPGSGGPVFKTDEVGGIHTPVSKVAFGVDGTITTVDLLNPLPVAVASAVISGEVALDAETLEALETVQIGNFPASQTVEGSVSVSNFPATQPISGAVSVSNFPVSQLVTGTFWQATQPVSGTVTANTGLSQPVTDAQLRAAPVPVSGTVSTGGLTDTQLRASAVPVSGTFYPATQAVSATSLPLPSGAATETTLSDLNTKTPAVGQATMAASRPVVLASNQSAIPVTGTFWQATQPISGTVTANTGLSQPVTDTQLRASDVKVSLDGEVVPITAVSLPLPLGAATELTSSSSDQLLDEIVFILQSMLEKMPRVTGNDQASVSVEAGSLSTVTTVTTCGTVTTVSQLGTRAAMTTADAMIMQGTSHIYNNLVVS